MINQYTKNYNKQDEDGYRSTEYIYNKPHTTSRVLTLLLFRDINRERLFYRFKTDIGPKLSIQFRE